MAYPLLHDQTYVIQFKSGSSTAIALSATTAVASNAEPHWTTDTNHLYVFNGTENVQISDWGYFKQTTTGTPVICTNINPSSLVKISGINVVSIIVTASNTASSSGERFACKKDLIFEYDISTSGVTGLQTNSIYAYGNMGSTDATWASTSSLNITLTPSSADSMNWVVNYSLFTTR